MTDSPKISVIIPVYNAEKYLEQCIDSILSQSLEDIEVICVDDGSTDQSPEILRAYAARDTRLLILNQQNKGGGAARNTGLAAAKGEYLLFLDADDFFAPTLLEDTYTQAVSTEADLVLCGAQKYDRDTDSYFPMPWMLNRRLLPAEKTFSATDIPRAMFQITSPAPWNKLLRRGFVVKESLQFQELSNSNDVYFTTMALALAPRISFLKKELVYYRVGHGNNVQSLKNNAPCDFYRALCAVRDELVRRGLLSLLVDSFGEFAESTLLWNLPQISEDALPQQERLQMQDSLSRKALYRLAARQNQAPALSVIIPAYNVESYLSKCIESVLEQTFCDFELICVDDGSTDGTLKILQAYEKQDARIRVIHKEKNEGALQARIAGAQQASALYLLYMDADDYLAPNACQQLIELIEEDPVDILQFAAGVEDYADDPAAKRWLEQSLRPTNRTLANEEILVAFYVKWTISTSLIGKLYTRSLYRTAISQIDKFHCHVGDDIFQQFLLAYYAKSYKGIETEPLYWYRRGLGISTSNVLSLETFELYCKMGELAERLYAFLREHDSMARHRKCCDAAAERMLQDCCRIYKNRLREEDRCAGGALILRYWMDSPIADRCLRESLGFSLKEFTERNHVVPNYVKCGRAFEEPANPPKVSVIIPVYNVQPYVGECVESVLNQTLQEIEVICVNDGSIDHSLEILEKYFFQDNRVTLISQNNGGQSAARNIGLEYARGEYILFLDGDDYLRPEAAERLTAFSDTHHLDSLFFEADTYYETEEMNQNFPAYEGYYRTEQDFHSTRTGQELFAALVSSGVYRATACLQLIRRGHLVEKGIRFYNGILQEDNLFTLQNLLLAESAAKINEAYYVRRIRQDSIMTKPKTFANLYGYLKCYANMLSFAELHSFQPATEKSIRTVINSMGREIGQIYSQIDPQERAKAKSLSPIDALWLQAVQGSLAKNALSSNTADISDEAQEIRSSRSYRLGRFLTFLPRKIRGGIRCLREHGLSYTIKLFFKKISNKLRG